MGNVDNTLHLLLQVFGVGEEQRLFKLFGVGVDDDIGGAREIKFLGNAQAEHIGPTENIMLLQGSNAIHTPFPIFSRDLARPAFDTIGRKGGDGITGHADGDHREKDGKEPPRGRAWGEIAITNGRHRDHRGIERIEPGPTFEVRISKGPDRQQHQGQNGGRQQVRTR